MSQMTMQLHNLEFDHPSRTPLQLHHPMKMAHSLPLPRAPFLSARTFTSDRLSHIPPLHLPESVDESLSSDNDELTSHSNSHSNSHSTMGVSYGSLRERHYQFGPGRSTNPPMKHSLRPSLAGHPSSPLPITSPPTQSTTNQNHRKQDSIPLYYPRSVPTSREMDRAWVEQRWRNQRPTHPLPPSIDELTRSERTRITIPSPPPPPHHPQEEEDNTDQGAKHSGTTSTISPSSTMNQHPTSSSQRRMSLSSSLTAYQMLEEGMERRGEERIFASGCLEQEDGHNGGGAEEYDDEEEEEEEEEYYDSDPDMCGAFDME